MLIACGIYPLTVWCIGQALFPAQANGSMVRNAAGDIIGSKLIAQKFTSDIYFHSRPSAANYDAAASASSSLAPSNYALRDRVARAIAPFATYADGQPVGPDIDTWFQTDVFNGEPSIVAQWAQYHPALAQAWFSANPSRVMFADAWLKQQGTASQTNPTDMAVEFFANFSKLYPGKFPVIVVRKDATGKDAPSLQLINSGAEIQSTFFDMWRQDNKDVKLTNFPADMVTTSASGLDPHISTQNAYMQLARVVAARSIRTERVGTELQKEIEALIKANARAPFGGLIGEPYVNVLELNLALDQRY
ncbi:MAG TPA: potassium-transporting ATPase subunit C, partial [Gammaproteobacteria bacterium]|nr:potassium-transporting ATPase subunit C [Gammaproteobacteria bacterium]